jgi:capsid protein
MQDVANQYGRDVEETFDQIKAEKELAQVFGISLAFQPFGPKLPAPSEVTDASTE